MTTQRVEHWPDLGYTCVAEPDPAHDGPYWIGWKLYTLFEGFDREGKAWRGWQRAGAVSSPDPVDDLASAEVYARGSTKWDGCMNWSFGEDVTPLHACGRGDLVALGLLLARVHDLCGDMMPAHRDFDPQALPGVAR